MRLKIPNILSLCILLIADSVVASNNVRYMMDTINNIITLGPLTTELDTSTDFYDDVQIHGHIVHEQGRELYDFCYTSPSNLRVCANYDDRRVQLVLIYYDIHLHWLPDLKYNLPRPVESEIFQAKEKEVLLPQRQSAKFVYYLWWRCVARIIQDMLHSSTGNMLKDMRHANEHLFDLSGMVLEGPIDMNFFWTQYRQLYQHYPAVKEIYKNWSEAISRLHNLLSEAMSLKDNEALLPPLKERYSYVSYSSYLLNILIRNREEWYDYESHLNDVNLLETVNRANTGLVVPILLTEHHYPHNIDYRHHTLGPVIRYLNENKNTGYHTTTLAGLCSSPNTRKVCVIVGSNLIPSILESLLTHDVEVVIKPYTALIHQVRLFEESTSVREWNRRLQGFYKDLSNFFPKSQKNEHLENWTMNTQNDLAPSLTTLTLYNYLHDRGKYMWLHLFNYLVNDIAYWSQEVQKLAFILTDTRKKSKNVTPFNPASCKEDQSTLYSCIMSIHNNVYQMEPSKLTMDKHYILFGNLDKLTEEIKKVLGISQFQTAMEHYRRSRSLPYKELLPARSFVLGHGPISRWSPDDFEEAEVGTKLEAKKGSELKRSLTTVKSPRQLYKAVGRALSEK